MAQDSGIQGTSGYVTSDVTLISYVTPHVTHNEELRSEPVTSERFPPSKKNTQLGILHRIRHMKVQSKNGPKSALMRPHPLHATY